MANGFDRLERFFAKRKVSTVPTDPSEPAIANLPPVIEQQFPSPSFIRPKVNRMAAREEVIVKQPSIRSPSVVGPPSPQRSISIKAQDSTCSSDSYRLHYSPVRTSSLRYLREQRLFDGFDDYLFPRPPTHNSEISPASSISNPSVSFELSNQRSHRRQADAGPKRLDTPPTSDPEDDDARCPRFFRNKELPDLPLGALPTPGPSPDLSPVLDYRLKESRSIEILKREVSRSINEQFHYSTNQATLRKTQSRSSMTLSISPGSLSSSTLREPDFDEFFNLRDEDIAESEPASPLMPSSDYLSSTILAPPRRQSLLTLTPPYASRPATAAAFEAARIANRYNFDLVYVVNLWPDMSALPIGGPEEDSVSFDSDFSAKPPHGLTGRLLAAYGLHHVQSPFQISAGVHAKILRSPGWIEYRNQDACIEEFTRGYACAFYTGQHSRASSITSSSSSTPEKMRKSDRGIVFAAYRKPRPDGNMARVGCTTEELADVHQDAEALVEMLIDIHSANRLRQPLSHSTHSDETGPMPVQRLVLD